MKTNLLFTILVSVLSFDHVNAQTKAKTGKELESLLPTITLAGFERQKPETNTINMSTDESNLSVGVAEVSYLKNDVEVKAVIFDYISDQASLQGMCTMINMNMSMDTDESSIKVKPYKNTKVLENIEKSSDPSDRKMMLFLCYKDRYYVAIEGSGIKDIGVLYNLLNDIKLSAL